MHGFEKLVAAPRAAAYIARVKITQHWWHI